jgi:hypothetical protein
MTSPCLPSADGVVVREVVAAVVVEVDVFGGRGGPATGVGECKMTSRKREQRSAERPRAAGGERTTAGQGLVASRQAAETWADEAAQAMGRWHDRRGDAGQARWELGV